MLPHEDNSKFTNTFDNLTPDVLKAIYLQLAWSSVQNFAESVTLNLLTELNKYIWKEYPELMNEIRKWDIKEFYTIN